MWSETVVGGLHGCCPHAVTVEKSAIIKGLYIYIKYCSTVAESGAVSKVKALCSLGVKPHKSLSTGKFKEHLNPKPLNPKPLNPKPLTPKP